MESWRERGFVPDSDSEEEFDSQESQNVIREAGHGEHAVEGNAVPQDPPASQDAGTPETEEQQQSTPENAEVDESQSTRSSPDALDTTKPSEDEDEEPTPKAIPRRRGEKDGLQKEDQVREQSIAAASQELPTAAGSSSLSTPKLKKQRDIWDVPSSSPDELQADYHPFLRKQAALSPIRPDASQPEPSGDDNDDDMASPLSSPPSSLHSLPANEDDRIDKKGTQPPLPERNLMDLLPPPDSSLRSSPPAEDDNRNDAEDTEQPLVNNLEDLLPPLDIPEDILQELAQPARRSLRQRNPIQLHPYLLEDAKYQSLMKARGVKPLRIAQYQEALRAARERESQGQEFIDNAPPPSSSPVLGLSSPAENSRLPEASTQSRVHQLSPTRERSGDAVRAPKRRRVAKPAAESRPQPRHLARPQVLIDNSSSPVRANGHSMRDVPPSPPRSGSLSPQAPQTFNGFKFPRGFSPPPLNTPSTTSRLAEKDRGDDVNDMELSDGVFDQGPEDAESIAPQDERPDSGEDEQDAEESGGDEDQNENQDESAVRRFQRRIKGVLPASWLRLDQQKQQDTRLNSTQRANERIAKMGNTKGVAKKVTKNTPGAHLSPRRRLESLQDLVDGEDSEDDGAGGNINARQALANLVGFDDPFNDQDPADDILEDNRIDYMFPAAKRAYSSRTGKQEKKRPRPEGSGSRFGGHPKRPRLQRQTRLTDSVHPPRREKKRTLPAPPRLGILDAPDIAAQPRSQQPQFLRVAARRVRSRQDRGRRSPSRKVFQLSTRADTEDANTSLREWRIGRLRQTKLPRPQVKPQGRPPLKDLPTNRSSPYQTHRPQNSSMQDVSDVQPEIQTEENQAAEPAPTADESTNPPSGSVNAPANSRQRDQGNKWFVRRNVTVSSLKRSAPRPVVPEIASSDNYSARPSLHRSLSLLNGRNHQRQPPSAYQQNPIMRRFLKSIPTPVPDDPELVSAQAPSTLRGEPSANNARAPRRQIRKRPPQRLNVTLNGDQGTLALATSDLEPPDTESRDIQSPALALDLTGFQSSYSVNFNIAPLHSGTFFRESTFIGSTEFARSLDLGKRDLDKDAGFYSLKVGEHSFRWGPWNDSVSSELGIAFDTMIDNVGESDDAAAVNERPSSIGNGVYRHLVKYVTETMTFIDPIDRVGFARRALSLASTLNDSMTALASKLPRDLELVTRLAFYNLVLIHQVRQIACNSNGLVNADVVSEASELIKLASKSVLTIVSSPAGQANISKFLGDQKSRELRESGARENFPVAEAYIILRKVLDNTDNPSGKMSDFLAEEYSGLGSVKDIESLETGWQRILNSLPLNEMDVFGIVQVGSRFREKHDNWSTIKHLLKPVFQAKDPNFQSPISYNNYCRILFHRCHYLINGWGWRDCKPILDTLYDLFAKNTLYNLKPEDNYTSPAFLDELDRNPSLEVQAGDPCFHIFLKIIGSGLRFLSKKYEKKKVRNITWRLLPNHGREYPKDRPIHQTDLDALRNHHDLLCTLYFAVPDGCRPRLETIKNLVDPARSHQETCNISLRSWSRLARFKLSTDEDVSGLESFADWHCYFVSKLLEQHSQAREEVEAQNTSENKFSHQLIERTISQNQRQIESQLKTALNLLQNAIRAAPSLDHAEKLVSKEPIKAVLGLFNSKVARVNTTVIEALQVIIVYLEKCRPQPAVGAAHVPVPVDEDSQEFGDWGVFDALYQEESPPAVTVPSGVEHVNKVFHPAVSRLVSNCFGEDHCPEDAILLSVVDCWTSLAEVLVKHKLQHWDGYFSHYGSDYSWTALRSTMQTRKFTPKFLASCIEKDSQVVSECNAQVFSMWMSSLVERESILKFQHCLTEALLNQDSTNPILQNLPFSSDKMDGRYHIALEELRQRRVSLLSSLLSNMRTHVQELEDADSPELSSTKQEYKELVQQLTSSMKANYQELGSGQASAQGEYVGFVHRVVGFLQQHTRDICLVDPFFTDPTSFPLPSTDPTYIVARLKGYEPKLSSKKIAKMLITFIQGVSERAAIDGQQVYLIGQLHASMMDSYETGDPDRPTLRAILLQAVFPAYLETAFSNRAAWVLCRPIIHAVSLTFKDLLFSMDATDPRCIASIIGIFNTVFQSSHHAIRSIILNPKMLNDLSVVITITSFLEMITSSLRVVDYIDQISEAADPLVSHIRLFQQFTLLATSHLHHNPLLTSDLDNLAHSSNTLSENLTTKTPSPVPTFFQEIRTSATRELQSYLSESWSRHQGKYYFTRRGNHQPQEIAIEPEVVADLEQPPSRTFDSAAGSFLDTAGRLGLLSGCELGGGNEGWDGEGIGNTDIDMDMDIAPRNGDGESVVEIQNLDLELPLDIFVL